MSEAVKPLPIEMGIKPGAFLHLLVVYLVWGSTYLATKICLSGEYPATPLQLQAARMSCAALLLFAYALVRLGPPRGITRTVALTSAGSGILLWVLGNGLTTLVAQDSTSSLIVMCMGLIPFWIVAIESVIQRSWPSSRALVGLVLGLVGLWIVLWPTLQLSQDVGIIRPGREFFVLSMLMIGGCAWALGTVVQRRQQSSVPIVWVATLQIGAAALVLLLLAALEHAPTPAIPLPQQVLAFGFLVVFGSVVAMISFQKVVRHFTPVIASTFAYVNPLVGMLLGVWILGEHIHSISIAGFLIILLGVWMVMRHPSTLRR